MIFVNTLRQSFNTVHKLHFAPGNPSIHVSRTNGIFLSSQISRSCTVGCLLPATYRCKLKSTATYAALPGNKSVTAGPAGSSGHWTLAQPIRLEVEVKKSKFIVTAWPITSSRQAMELIKTTGNPAASHNCYAYKLGLEIRSSDDGEPGGTAGRPILSAIEGEGLEAVCVLVTRYYGGVKLGAGGLVRAYGGAARDCLKQAPKVFIKRKVKVQLTAPFSDLGAVYHCLDKHACDRLQEEYLDTGICHLIASLDADLACSFITDVADITSGTVTATVLQEPEEQPRPSLNN